MLDLAYQAAEIELGYKVLCQNTNDCDAATYEQGLEVDKRAPLALNGVEQKAIAKVIEPINSQTDAVPQQQLERKVENESVHKQNDEWESDLKEFMPITLSGDTAHKKKIDMPKGMKNLVMGT